MDERMEQKYSMYLGPYTSRYSIIVHMWDLNKNISHLQHLPQGEEAAAPAASFPAPPGWVAGLHQVAAMPKEGFRMNDDAVMAHAPACEGPCQLHQHGTSAYK